MKVAIAGGGLVGALCACVLGQKGHHVTVFEYRQDPRSEEGRFVRGRSINLALSVRGRKTLRRAGLEDVVLSKAIPMKGRMLHSKDGSKKEFLYDPNTNQCIYSVSRSYLNELLLTEAEKIENVKLEFNHKMLTVDTVTGKSTYRRRDTGGNIEVQSDFIIGADGAHSATRAAMLRRPLMNFSQQYIEHGYMELCIPAKENGEHAMEKNYLHIWPRDRYMLIALPNLDGSFTVTLFMPFAIFHKLTTAELVQQFFKEEFPDAIQLIGSELLCKDFLSSTPSPLISVKVSPLNAGRTVLIGDAAHAMVPFYGQGMNAGFEDVLVLDDILDSEGNRPIEKRLELFTERRSKDAQAICELAMYNYVEMRHLVNQKLFHFRRHVDVFLNKMFGTSWMPLYNNVTFSSERYSHCIQHKEWQDKVIKRMKWSIFWLTTGVTAAWAVKNWDHILAPYVHQFGHKILQLKSH